MNTYAPADMPPSLSLSLPPHPLSMYTHTHKKIPKTSW